MPHCPILADGPTVFRGINDNTVIS